MSSDLVAPAKATQREIADDVVQDLWVPKTCSTSCDQVIFVDQATDLSLSSDAVQVEIDRLG